MHAFGQYPRAVLLGDFNAPAHHAAMCRGMPPDTKDALSGLDDQDRVDMILVRGRRGIVKWFGMRNALLGLCPIFSNCYHTNGSLFEFVLFLMILY